MSGFPSIKGVRIDKELVKKLQKKFPNWSMFSVGKTKTNITDSGGIHFSGTPTITNSISFEIKRGKTYIIVSLFEYPKGLVFHAHVYFPDVDAKTKDGWKTIIDKIYSEVNDAISEGGKHAV